MTDSTKTTKPKIYLWAAEIQWGSYGRMRNEFLAYALAEDGTGLCSHLSSSVGWAKHDVGLTSNWKHDLYDEHYPDGYELVWLDNPETDPGWLKAKAINDQKAKQK